MKANKGADTAPELRLRSALHALGWRYRVNFRLKFSEAAVRPDIVFTRRRVAVFIDGCFWHGCPVHMSWPKRNAAFWKQKIEANRARDEMQDRLLREAGWTVVRLWEHQLDEDALELVVSALRDSGRVQPAHGARQRTRPDAELGGPRRRPDSTGPIVDR
jgi:DNA mismatch endonuclease (patch repair protein)